MYTASRDLFKASHLETTSKVGSDLRQFVIIHVFWCFFHTLLFPLEDLIMKRYIINYIL